ncbi:MAG TPA: hypothetical protein VF157_10985, partial [Chloroflexota bacterium]
MSTVVQAPRAARAAPPRRSAATPPKQPSLKRAFAVPGGPLTLIGFAAAAEAMANSVAAAHWQPGLTGLPWLVGLAVLLGYLCTRGRHMNWVLWGLGLVAGLGASVRLPAAGFMPGRLGWTQQLFAAVGQLLD